MHHIKRVLLTGASGFIGSHIRPALRDRAVDVVAPTRRDGHDFNKMLGREAWLPLLDGVDAAINCAGTITEQRGQSFDVLHHRAPTALFQACQQSNVRRVIQISALGADEEAFTPYQRSKRAADEELRRLKLDWFILRPSLVYGEGSTSLKLFNAMADLPLIPLIDGGRQLIQPVHISDVVATVITSLTHNESRQTLDIVGPHPVRFAEWLQQLRARQGKSRGPTLDVPSAMAISSAQVMRFFSPLFHPDNLRMLQKGNYADATPLTQFLGRPPLAIEQAW